MTAHKFDRFASEAAEWIHFTTAHVMSWQHETSYYNSAREIISTLTWNLRLKFEEEHLLCLIQDI
jgi:hypothetical protein